MTIKTTRSESNLHSMRPKKLERRDQTLAVPGNKSRGLLLRKLDGSRKQPPGEGKFMREKYPSASLQRPLVVEYYKLNDLAGDHSVRLPPRLPITQNVKASKDPRFTSSFCTLDHGHKVEILKAMSTTWDGIQAGGIWILGIPTSRCHVQNFHGTARRPRVSVWSTVTKW